MLFQIKMELDFMKYFKFKINYFFLKFFERILAWQYRIYCKCEDFTFKDFEIEKFLDKRGIKNDFKGR